ncbi:lytic transglycosylase domain-containing protein [Allofournierella sp.]|uniref:lytic transglycosylase domain-containing protein n=1 Tax=Allofournierella sp. TaxID=1940256 RepID=UPI003AB63B03
MAKKKRRWVVWLLLLALLAAAGIWVLRVGLHRLDLARYPQKYSEAVDRYAAENGLDPLLVYTVIRTESGFDAAARSGVGARGLMQITEETFSWIKSKLAPAEELTFDDLYDPAVNIRFGAYYFAACMARYQNDVSTAAAAYRSGWGTVDKLLANEAYSADGKVLHTFPYEQMGLYVRKINRNYQKYQTLYQTTENEG